MSLSISPQKILLGSTQVLYDCESLSTVTAELFKPQTSAGVAEVHGLKTGRGDARFYRHEGLDLVLRHYRRGGLMRHLFADRYIGFNPAGSRPFREWRLLADLYQRGLPVPRPVAAAYQPAGFCYRGDLITCQIAASRPLSLLLQTGVSSDLWMSVGKTVRRFHDQQVFHADLNAHNILIDEQQTVYVIDFDRGAIRPGSAWKEANLKRLLRSLRKLTQGQPEAESLDSGWCELLRGYRQTC